MFKTRLLSGILLVLIALVTIISGGPVLFATMVIISAIGLSELYRVFKIDKTLLGLTGAVFSALYYILLWLKDSSAGLPGESLNWFMGLFMAMMISMIAVMVFSYPKFHAEQLLAAFFGVFYVVVMLSYIYQIRVLPGGAFTVWLVFVCSWGCDTCAYCVGMLIGKHKMAPKLSPKKSVEGGIGGIGGAISQIGDLGASAIKRNYDIKDYGTLIPGHGGILDRFDSVIFTAPIIYYLAVML